MRLSSTSTLAIDSTGDLDTMDTIVRELVTGSIQRRQDPAWLDQRVRTAGLGEDARAALEAVRRKICSGVSLLLGDGVPVWEWRPCVSSATVRTTGRSRMRCS